MAEAGTKEVPIIISSLCSLFGPAEPNDQLCSVLAAGPTGDAGDDLLLGAILEDVGSLTDTGPWHLVRSLIIYADGLESGATGRWDATAP